MQQEEKVKCCVDPIVNEQQVTPYDLPLKVGLTQNNHQQSSYSQNLENIV